MCKFFLLNEAIDSADIESFKTGISELITIETEQEDEFLKHQSIYNLPIFISLYSNYGQVETVIIKYLEQLQTIDICFDNIDKFNAIYSSSANAFTGIDFSGTGISPDIQIIDNDSYKHFKKSVLWNVNYRNFWSKRTKLFPNIILCGEVESQISRIGTSQYFVQIIEKLKIFDGAVSEWNTGNFSYKEINRRFALNISPESEATMSRYGNERIFKLPNGNSEIFELHIKTGDLRFHFYVNNSDKSVYVGYIGHHLNTINT
jgi:hypothetical protein